MTQPSTLRKNIGIYSFASQLTQVITMAASILTRRFLEPYIMGIWATLQIILDYSKYTTLGTTNVIGREIPYYLGKKEPQKADEVKNLVASFSILTAVITAVGVVVYAYVVRRALPPHLFSGLLFTAVLILLQRGSNILVNLLRACKLFTLAGKFMIYSAFINMILIILLTSQFKLYGFLTAQVLSLIFNVGYVLWKHNFHFKWVLNQKLGGLIHFGFPLMMLGVIHTLFNSIDKIVIIKMLGFEAMGFYSIAIMATNFIEQLPTSIAVVLVPHFQEKYAIRDNKNDVRQAVDKSLYALILILAVIISVMFVWLPPTVMWILPRYTPGIRASQILLLSSFFFAASVPYQNLMITLKTHMRMFPIMATSIAMAVVTNLFAIKMGWGIEGIAIATVVTAALHITLFFWGIGSTLYSLRDGLKVFGILAGNFAYLVLILFLVDRVKCSSLSLELFLRNLMLLGLLTPVLYQLESRFAIARYFWNTVIRRSSR